eukprot:158127-Prymnesium_polylepis.1
MLTAFLALTDVTLAMGPTRVWPGTHAAAWHCRLLNLDAAATAAALRERPAFDCDVRRGDCVLMDSRLWHCGGANVSEERRTLLVATFLGSCGQPPYGSTWSLLEHLAGQISLRALVDEADAAAGDGAKRGAPDGEAEGGGTMPNEMSNDAQDAAASASSSDERRAVVCSDDSGTCSSGTIEAKDQATQGYSVTAGTAAELIARGPSQPCAGCTLVASDRGPNVPRVD